MTTATTGEAPPLAGEPDERAWAPPPRPRPRFATLAAWGIIVALFAASIWSMYELRINISSLVDSLDNARLFVSRMFPLDFPPMAEILPMVWETMSIVILATALCVVLAIPLAMLAAWNTSPGRGARASARFLIVLARAIPDMVLAVVFFRLFGLGGLPGVLAMGLHSVGMVGRLYADSLENLPSGPHDALRAQGAAPLQRILTGYVPAWTPHLISVGLYRIDINLRTSVLLGYVGVGGIGLAMANSLRSLQYQRGMALALIVLGICLAVELLSGAIRAALRGKRPRARRWPVGSSAPRHSASAGQAGAQHSTAHPALRPVPDSAAQAQPRLSPPWTATRVMRALGCLAFAALLVAAWFGARIDLGSMVTGVQQLPATLSFFLPPATGDILPSISAGMLVTIQIALASTLLGAILAIPAGVFAARTVYPHPLLNTGFRVFIVSVRAIPEVILAIIMVVITGLGGVAGTLALAVGCVGMLGKLVADSIEETDTRVQEALRAAGASRTQVFWAATVRQVLPAIVSHVMYILDNHVRSATLLGVVGAGGIGFLLLNAARVAEYDVITTIMIAILATVLLVEGLSVAVRRALR